MKKAVKKIFCIFSALLLLAAPLGISGVYANETTSLKITSSQVMEIDDINPNQINFYTDAGKTTRVGSIQVMLMSSPDPLTPIMSENEAVYELDIAVATAIAVELQPNSAANYIAPDNYSFGGNMMPLSSTMFSLPLTGGMQNMLSLDFKENNGGNPPGPGPGPDIPEPIMDYPVIARFDVPGQSPIDVLQNDEGHIVIPDNWTSGRVVFQAVSFTRDDGSSEPFTGQVSGGTRRDVDLDIEGIFNGEELNATVTISMDRKSAIITEGFSEYGKLQLHLISGLESSVNVNKILSVVHRNSISVKAEAPLPLSQSFGTIARNQAIITKDEVKDVETFFGNIETTLTVTGLAVDKITEVQSASLRSVTLNADGSATVVLPSLSTETTTPVQITIRKIDGSSINRNINIVRTAIRLAHFYHNDKESIYAEYIVNKGYLYNNQPHNDEIFNAYLQVTLYKDNTVVGYNQIKIDDAELVNSLQDNESGSMELYGEHQIAIYGEDAGNYIEGVNKVSVFLTNGPIDFSSEELPSVEFGTGNGVTVQFGGETND